MFLNPHDCLTGIDSTGCVYFWTTKPSLIQHTQLGKRNYQALSFQGVLSNFYVTCYGYFEKLKYMILGDEFGNITVWNCSELMEWLDDLNGKNLTRDEVLIKLLKLDGVQGGEGGFMITQISNSNIEDLVRSMTEDEK